MFQPAFNFYKGYVIPRVAKLEEIIDFIQLLPAYDTPEVFGLHPNADITYVLHPLLNPLLNSGVDNACSLGVCLFD